jgi:hypothetical protein
MLAVIRKSQFKKDFKKLASSQLRHRRLVGGDPQAGGGRSIAGQLSGSCFDRELPGLSGVPSGRRLAIDLPAGRGKPDPYPDRLS